MKSLKKTLVLLVVFSMILSTLVPAFAFDDVAGLDCEDQVTRMVALGIIEGFAEDGTFRPDETVTRAQMAVIIGKMVGITAGQAEANANVASKFSDVATTHWANGWINLASNNGIISGYPDGTFRPEQTLTLNEVLTLCVKALGRGGYVDKMGTWPANYVTEAARLNLLKDVKGASDAKRGNVAVIAWNTLNAATWYVNAENLDGEVSLGAGYDAKTLLAINFSDFVTEDGETFKEIEEVELKAANFADNNRQLVFTADDANVWAFKAEFDKEPSKNKDEKSFKNKEGDKLYVYVPEEVVADLDELEDKEVKIILGEDNVAVMIVIEDDIAEKDFLTAYDADKEKIVVGGTKYTLSEDGVTVKLNGKTGYTLETALTALGVVDAEDIEKKIEATVTLDSEDEVEAIELLASATISGVSREVIVTKVTESRTTYKIETTDGTIKWDLEDEEDEEIEFPKVYVDGARADIRDIEAGNVLTVMSAKSLGDVEDIAKIFVSTETVSGEATKVKKSNNAITVDGEVYLRTDANVEVADEDELEDLVWGSFVPANITNSEGVTLYLNMFGEYVAVVLTEATSEYTFGVVTFVSDNTNWDDEDENILTRKIRVLLPNGEKPSYVVTVDTDDKDIDAAAEELFGSNPAQDEGHEAEEFVALGNLPIVGEFIMFEATADNKIVIEEGNEIVVLPDLDENDNEIIGKIAGTDYIFARPVADSVEKDDEEFTVNNGTEEVTAEYDAGTTVIFNAEEKEIVSKWKSVLADDDNFHNTAFMIFEDEDADAPMYIVVAIPDTGYAPDDVKYAMVEDSTYKSGDDWFVNFVGEDALKVSTTNNADESLKDIDGAFVEYIMSGSKVSVANMLLDVVKFADLADDDAVTNGIINSGVTSHHIELGTTKYTDTMHIDIVADQEAKDTGNWGASFTATGYAELLLDNIYPKESNIRYTSINDALAVYGDLYFDEETGKYTKSDVYDASGSNPLDQATILLVKADGKVHEIEFSFEYENAEGKTIKEHYTIYATATINTDLSDTIVSYLEKGNFKVAEVSTKNKDYTRIYYTEDEDRAIDELGDVKVDNDAQIYVVSADGTIEEGSWDDVVKGAYAITYGYDLDAGIEANIVVVIAD